VQEFINETAMNCLYTITSEEKSVTDKMDALDWLVRDMEFISKNINTNVAKKCETLYQSPNNGDSLINQGPHASQINNTIKRLISDCSNFQETNLIKFLPKYLDYLEIILGSQYNQEKIQELGLHFVLIKIIVHYYDQND
jgi:hypothetical protein